MASQYVLARPKPAEIEDREEAVATIDSLLDENVDGVTWVQFRYRIIRGGAGLSRTTEEAAIKGVDRDLGELTIEEVGSGGVDELRAQLPEHEIAYVVYNNSKGSQHEDIREREKKARVGFQWKQWQAYRVRETARFKRHVLLQWAAEVEQIAKDAECLRLQKLAADLGIYLPVDVPLHDPVKMVEFVCIASPNLNKVFKKALEELYDDAEDASYTVLMATMVVAQHLDHMQEARLKKIRDDERQKKERIRQRKIAADKKALFEKNNKAAAEKHAQRSSGRRRANVESDSRKTKALELDAVLNNHGQGRESARSFTPTELTEELSDGLEEDSFNDGDSTQDTRSMTSKAQSPLSPMSRRSRQASHRSLAESPLIAESPLQGGEARRHRRLEVAEEETGSDFGKSLESERVQSARASSQGDPNEEIAGMEWDEDYEDKEANEDAYFQWTIEEEARRLAIAMEQAANRMQAVARGYRDRERVRNIKRGQKIFWDKKHLQARLHHVVVVLVWCPESTSTAMRELPLYHMRDVIDLVNDAAAAAYQAKEEKQLAELLRPDAAQEAAHEQGLSTQTSATKLMPQKSFDSVASSSQDDSRDSTAAVQKSKQLVPLVPHVVHRAREWAQMERLCIADTILINYFGGEVESDESDTEAQEFVVTFGEQQLYEELVQKYSDILELPGVSRENSLESRRAWAERLETKSLRLARASYRAQQEILRRRRALRSSLASRQKSRMMQKEQRGWTSRQHDACESTLAAAKPCLADLKHKFNHREWWELTFPTRQRITLTEGAQVLDLLVSHDAPHSPLLAPVTSSTTSSEVDEDELREEKWKQDKEDALSRIQKLSRMSSDRELDGSLAVPMAREPSLKTVARHPGTFSTLGSKEWKQFYALKCKAIKVQESQPNLQSFLHTVAHSCSDTCFNLVDVGVDPTALNFLLTELTNKVVTLTELNLARNPLGDQGATHISRFLLKNRTLTSLKLESALIGPAGQVSLFTVLKSYNFRIEKLNLGGLGGTPLKNVCGEVGALAASAALRANSTLTCLSLAQNCMARTQVEVLSKGLSKNFQLTKLDLSHNVFGDGGTCALASALETLQLKFLNLSRTEMSDVGACALAKALSSCRPPIHTVLLTGNNIAERGTAAFAAVIQHKNTVLSTLRLDHNKLGHAAAQSLAEKSVFATSVVKDKYGRQTDLVIYYPRALTDLNLSSNGLKDEGAKFMAEVIKHNSILTKLDLSDNGIGDQGIKDIGMALPSNSTLVSLSLASNSLTSPGIQHLAGTRESPTAIHLQHLDLSGNLLTQGAGEHLYALAHACTSLTQLDMDGTFLSAHENAALEGILAQNVKLSHVDDLPQMQKKLSRLEVQAALADKLLAELAAEKKQLFQINSKIEMLRSKCERTREDGINDYIRIQNSKDQAKRREQTCEHEMKDLDKQMSIASQMYAEQIAVHTRRLHANFEGAAWQMSINQQLKGEKENILEGERKQKQHLLNDFDVVCDKKEFSIKKHQKFRHDMLQLLKEDQRFLSLHVADESWELLENDPTLKQEEDLQVKRTWIANQRIELERNETKKVSMVRAARRAGVMMKYAAAARQENEEGGGVIAKMREMFSSCKLADNSEEGKKKKLLGKMMNFRSKIKRTGSSSNLTQATSTSILSRTSSFSRSQASPTPSPLSAAASAGGLTRMSSIRSSPVALSREASRDLASPALSREVSRDLNDSAGPESAAGERGSAMPSASMLPLQTPLEGIKEVKPSGGKAGRSPDVKEKKKHFFGDGDDVGGVEGAIKPKPFSGAPARKKDKSKTAEAACAQLSADSIGSAGKSKGKGSNKAPKRQPAVKGHPDAETQETRGPSRERKEGVKEGECQRRGAGGSHDAAALPVAQPATHEPAGTEAAATPATDAFGNECAGTAGDVPMEVRRQGPKSEGVGGQGAVRMLLKPGGQVDQSVMRGLLDVQQRFLLRMNYEKGAWMTNLEQQQEMRRPLAVGFMEARRIRRLAELQEAINQKAAAVPSFATAKPAKAAEASAAVAGPGERLSSSDVPNVAAEATEKHEVRKPDAVKRKKKKTA